MAAGSRIREICEKYLISEIDSTMNTLNPFLNHNNNNGIISMVMFKRIHVRKELVSRIIPFVSLECLSLMPKSSVGFACCSTGKLVWGYGSSEELMFQILSIPEEFRLHSQHPGKKSTFRKIKKLSRETPPSPIYKISGEGWASQSIPHGIPLRAPFSWCAMFETADVFYPIAQQLKHGLKVWKNNSPAWIEAQTCSGGSCIP